MWSRPYHRGYAPASFRRNAPERSITVYGETLVHPEASIAKAKGTLKVFRAPQPNRLWFYFTGESLFRSWIFYEALPERLLTRESGERVLTVIENYQQEEQRRRATPPGW